MVRRIAGLVALLASSPAFAEEREPIGSELAAGVAGGLLGMGVGIAGGVAIGKTTCGDSLDCIGFAVVGLGVGAAVGAGAGIAYGGNHNGRTGSYGAAIGGTVVGAGTGVALTVLAIVATQDPEHPDRNVVPIGIAGTALTVLAGYGGGLLGYHWSSEATVTAMPMANGGGVAFAGRF